MRRIIAALMCSLGLAGCAVVRTTDVTDASFKRHQSVALLGWPIYTRVTDKEPGLSATTAMTSDGSERTDRVRAAELLDGSIEPDWP